MPFGSYACRWLKRIINWYNDGLVTLCHQSLCVRARVCVCIVMCLKAPFELADVCDASNIDCTMINKLNTVFIHSFAFIHSSPIYRYTIHIQLNWIWFVAKPRFIRSICMQSFLYGWSESASERKLKHKFMPFHWRACLSDAIKIFIAQMKYISLFYWAMGEHNGGRWLEWRLRSRRERESVRARLCVCFGYNMLSNIAGSACSTNLSIHTNEFCRFALLPSS